MDRCSKWGNCLKMDMLYDKHFDIPNLYVELEAKICKDCPEQKKSNDSNNKRTIGAMRSTRR